MLDITVAIPSIPQRKMKLRQAVSSVLGQTHPASGISIAMDLSQQGSAVTRNRALMAVNSEWVAFLDDDDVLLPHHLAVLAQGAVDSGADVIYGLPRVLDPYGNIKPRHWQWGGPTEFDAELLRQASYITVSSLVRTELAKDCGGFVFHQDARFPGESYDDHGFYLRLLDAEATFHHVHQETFIWNHHGMNTSGKPNRGDAALR